LEKRRTTRPGGCRRSDPGEKVWGEGGGFEPKDKGLRQKTPRFFVLGGNLDTTQGRSREKGTGKRLQKGSNGWEGIYLLWGGGGGWKGGNRSREKRVARGETTSRVWHGVIMLKALGGRESTRSQGSSHGGALKAVRGPAEKEFTER